MNEQVLISFLLLSFFIQFPPSRPIYSFLFVLGFLLLLTVLSQPVESFPTTGIAYIAVRRTGKAVVLQWLKCNKLLVDAATTLKPF